MEYKQLRRCLACKALVLVIWGKLGRGRGHTPLVTLRKIGRGRREELMRQNHSGHVVVEAHLTVVRAVGRESRSAQIRCRDAQVQIRRVNAVGREH